MAQDTTPSIIVYQGDGTNHPFSIPFDKGYYGEVKVLFVRRGLADYTYEPTTYEVNGRLYAWSFGSDFVYTHTANPAVGAKTYDYRDVEQSATVSAIAGQTITVDGVIYNRSIQSDIANNLLLTWTGDVLQVGDFIAIIRDTERGQPYEYPNNQKHIERALDNLERQIQEVKDATDNALKVDPAHTIDPSKMSPIDWMNTILRSVDLSVRALRFTNGWVDYSLDDPNIANIDKTWYHLLNTENIKNIRESSRIESGKTIYWTEYQASDGSWKTLCDPVAWDQKIDEAKEIAQEAKEIAQNAKDVADDAKDIAQDAKDIVDTVDGRVIQAEQDASDAKDIAQDAKDIADTASDKVDDLEDEIDSLKGIGRFLSIWNCTTGLAETNPPESPYTYRTGDYFLVGTVSSATPAVNYKPDGSSYTTGVASTTVETDTVKVNDIYVYDGTNWKLQINSQRDVVFSGITGSPYDNTALSNAFGAKQDTLVSAVNIKTINNNDILGSGNLTISGLPTQTGHSGDFLSTDGTNASWVTIEQYTANEVETLWNSI